MDILSIFTLFGGLAFFLFGMNFMGDNLEKLSGGKLERILEKLTNNTIKGVLLGAGVTCIIQSSSATTVMAVGFVNSGIMKLSQAIGIIMGANVGTTITAWILSLTGIQGDSILMKLLKPESFSPIIAVIGIILIMLCKEGKKRDVGNILVGFAILMFGMETMSDAVKPLAEIPEFASFLTMFENPFFGVIAGALLTAIIQSSSASVGILQALTVTGAISFASAIPIIMGQNIGTCATALISCIGANKNAKRTAFVHLYFNIIGTIVWLSIFYIANAIFHFGFIDQATTPADIALIHSIFNLASTALLLPFAKQLGKLATLTIPDKGDDDDMPFIDERFLNAPSFAVEQCKNMTNKMAELSKKNLFLAMSQIGNYSQKDDNEITENENKIDMYEDVLGTYLVKLSSKSLTIKDSNEISKILHAIGDIERIGDHAVNILGVAKEMDDKKLSFSDKAQEEIGILSDAIKEIVTKTMNSFENSDVTTAHMVEPLEEVIDELKAELKIRHIRRLREGRCTIELGFILQDLITNYERISDHCSNIAVCVIEIDKTAFDTHEYLHEIKTGSNSDFVKYFQEYENKYALPKSNIKVT